MIFTTAFINIYDDFECELCYNGQTHKWRIDHFYDLLEKTNIKTVLYVSDDFYNLLIDDRRFDKFNCQINKEGILFIVPFCKNDLLAFRCCDRHDDITLPLTRNEIKDTFEYMALMNSKLEFIEMTIKNKYFLCDSDDVESRELYGWIDFNISYIFKEKESTYLFLKEIINIDIADKSLFIIPGCWDRVEETAAAPPPTTLPPDIFESINWRFCGGFFIADKKSILDFCEIYQKELLYLLLKKKCIIWETNLWALLEIKNLWHPTHWYKVPTHDDTMITAFPKELLNMNYSLFLNSKYIYNKPLLLNYTHADIPDYFNASSGSVIIKDDKYIFMMRYVNYSISDDGLYYIFNNAADNVIQNKNIIFEFPITADFKGDDYYYKSYLLDESALNESTIDNSISYGLEDIRLYDDFSFSASSVSYCGGIVPQIIHGFITKKNNVYSVVVADAHAARSTKHIKSPISEYQIEKNWIWIPETMPKKIIYKWSLYQLISADYSHDNTTEYLQRNILLPEYIFKNIRGSSPLCCFDDDYWICVVHYSVDTPAETIKRNYFHLLILINKKTNIPEYRSQTFYFGLNKGIEYCIGMNYDMVTKNIFFLYSIMDKKPHIALINIKEFNFMDVKCYCS